MRDADEVFAPIGLFAVFGLALYGALALVFLAMRGAGL